MSYDDFTRDQTITQQAESSSLSLETELPRHDAQTWFVYIILCSDNSLYTGITNNVTKRFHHHSRLRGAKYFRSRKPIRLIYLESGHTRSTAGQREWLIKKMGRAEKLLLVDSPANALMQSDITGNPDHRDTIPAV